MTISCNKKKSIREILGEIAKFWMNLNEMKIKERNTDEEQ